MEVCMCRCAATMCQSTPLDHVALLAGIQCSDIAISGDMITQIVVHAAHVQVRTYDVVPITPSLGMVAFVEGTKPLKALLTDPALIAADAIAAADEKFARFIMTKGGNLDRAGLSDFCCCILLLAQVVQCCRPVGCTLIKGCCIYLCIWHCM